MIEVYTLYSGSSGNSIFVRYNNTRLLFDAGRSERAISTSLASLGESLDRISAIFITHEHSDHTSALEVISKKHSIPVHMTAPSYCGYVRADTFLEKCACVHDVCYKERVGELNIRSFPIPHDASQNVGYVIESPEGEKFGIATDIGHLTDEIVSSLLSCRKVIIESNHDINMLKNGPYPSFLKARILSDEGHLSNEACAKLACTLAGGGVENITLAHLSRENNTPELAYNQTKRALDMGGFSVTLRVASPSMCVDAYSK